VRKAILDLLDVKVNQPLTPERILTCLAVTLVMSLILLIIYRYTWRGVLYNHNFARSLILVSMITCLVILPISSNIVLSLGMVGALSIVRYRTALKDPMDIAFMFWAISIGLTSGAGFFIVAIIGTLAIGLIILLMSLLGNVKFAKSYLLILNLDPGTRIKLSDYLPRYDLQSQTITPTGIELVISLRLKDKSTVSIQKLMDIEGVQAASLVAHAGET